MKQSLEKLIKEARKTGGFFLDTNPADPENAHRRGEFTNSSGYQLVTAKGFKSELNLDSALFAYPCGYCSKLTGHLNAPEMSKHGLAELEDIAIHEIVKYRPLTKGIEVKKPITKKTKRQVRRKRTVEKRSFWFFKKRVRVPYTAKVEEEKTEYVEETQWVPKETQDILAEGNNEQASMLLYSVTRKECDHVSRYGQHMQYALIASDTLIKKLHEKLKNHPDKVFDVFKGVFPKWENCFTMIPNGRVLFTTDEDLKKIIAPVYGANNNQLKKSEVLKSTYEKLEPNVVKYDLE
ncbi:hypothetical protein KY311_02705 [Candidatus Woesearchaeota archaeon]|nr:hypothetical protein [Candidatus Woesearchaeota archaeon]